jgi:hypothetical protein
METAMIKKLPVLLAVGMGVCVLAADGGRDIQKMRLAALEAMQTSQQALITAKWRNLAQLDAQIKDLASSDEQAASETDVKNADRVEALLRNAIRRQTLEAERLDLLRSLRDGYVELTVLQGEIQKLRTDLREARQVLDGHWTLVLMPADTRGDVYLSQNGTLLTGDYTLDNGQAGSLQGTFINNQLFLERIDAKFGKMGRLDGTLSSDQKSVRGSWFSYEIGSGQPITGAFSLERAGDAGGLP